MNSVCVPNRDVVSTGRLLVFEDSSLNPNSALDCATVSNDDLVVVDEELVPNKDLLWERVSVLSNRVPNSDDSLGGEWTLPDVLGSKENRVLDCTAVPEDGVLLEASGIISNSDLD